MATCASLTTGTTVFMADPCKDNTLAKIEAYTENFFDRIGKIDSAVLNLSNEIKDVVNVVGDTANGFINAMLGGLQDKLAELIPQAIKILETILQAPPFLFQIPQIIAVEAPMIPLVKTMFDGLFCAATKVMKGAKDAFADIMTAAAKNVLSGTACAAQEIVGAFTNNLVNIVDSIAGPLIEPISNILNAFTGGIFNFNVKDFLLTGISLARKVQNLFSCGDEKICPATSKLKIDQGPLKDLSEEDQDSMWNTVFSGTAISQGATNLSNDFEKAYGKWNIFGSPLGESSSLEPCNFGNVTKCGLPTVSFFGGDGIGGAGNVLLGNIIDNVDTEDAVGDVLKIGSIVGVELTDPGLGYTDPPIVTFQDSCNKGYGAYGRAIIDEIPTSPTFGQIIAVVMTSEGVNYPAEIDELPLFIKEIIIEDPGNDIEAEEIEIEGVDLEIENGRVIRATPKPFAYNGLPTLNISGAILRPIMTTTPPPSEIIKVIDCISS
jgi:hypothetical protein